MLQSEVLIMELKPHLEYLSAREQLIEDIDSIIGVYFDERYDMEDPDYQSVRDDLITQLCDVVCKHFPTQAQDSIQSVWVPKSLPLDS